MAKVLQNIFVPDSDEIAQNFTIESWHVSQSVDALTGAEAYDITISGSLELTGSFSVNGLPQNSGAGYYSVVVNNTTGQFGYSTSGGGGGSGTSGTSGATGTSGTSGTRGSSGSSGASGSSGSSGTSGLTGTSGTSGLTGTSGTSGANGSSGTSGIPGSSGTSGGPGTSGTSGASGTGFGLLTPNTGPSGQYGFLQDTVPDNTGYTAAGWIRVTIAGNIYYIPAWQ